MPSITTWTRLEPRSRANDMQASLEGRLIDATWLLGRQWQVGEFVGADAGTPISANIDLQACAIRGYSAGTSGARAYVQEPLDALAGPEPPSTPTTFDAAESGAELLTLCAAYGVSTATQSALVTAYALAAATGPVDAAGASLLVLLAGRLIDGTAIAPVIRASVTAGSPAAALTIPPADAASFMSAAGDWVSWLDSLLLAAPARGDAWGDDELAYTFSVGVDQGQAAPLALAASAWDGERCDWYDLDLNPAQSGPVAGTLPQFQGFSATGSLQTTAIPAPLGYPGMPPVRWWQFDDGYINFADVTAATDDLARMLVVEFASIYSNDWYLWPLRLPTGALHVVGSLTVSTTFGDAIALGPAGSANGTTAPIGDWALFRNSVSGAQEPQALNGLLLLPAMVDEVHSESFERVSFARDDVAALAWAIEQTITGADGRAFDRHAAEVSNPVLSPATPHPPSSDVTPLTYELRSTVPTYWFPMTPNATRVDYVLETLRRIGPSGAVQDIEPAGVILSPTTSPFATYQHAVPPEGTQLTRRYHLTRAIDGRVLLWQGRTKRIGRGPIASGLNYDSAT